MTQLRVAQLRKCGKVYPSLKKHIEEKLLLRLQMLTQDYTWDYLLSLSTASKSVLFEEYLHDIVEEVEE